MKISNVGGTHRNCEETYRFPSLVKNEILKNDKMTKGKTTDDYNKRYSQADDTTKDGNSKRNGEVFATSNYDSFRSSSFGFCDSSNQGNDEHTHKS